MKHFDIYISANETRIINLRIYRKFGSQSMIFSAFIDDKFNKKNNMKTLIDTLLFILTIAVLTFIAFILPSLIIKL